MEAVNSKATGEQAGLRRKILSRETCCANALPSFDHAPEKRPDRNTFEYTRNVEIPPLYWPRGGS
jgi:hypothetical protein